MTGAGKSPVSTNSVQVLLRGMGARLAGRERGPDHGSRRTPRRNSYDVDDIRARPWSKIGDGSFKHGIAYREALLEAANERYHQDWKELSRAVVRNAREKQAALSAELDGMIALGAGPVGRAAAIRQELGPINALLERARLRLRFVDLKVLQTMLGLLDFATGALYPSLEKIAAMAGCSRNAVINALERLKAHGMISSVRRSVKTANEGQFAPQREQTSNAYFFEHRRRMEPGTFKRYTQLLVRKLRRLGKVPPGLASPPDAPASPPLPHDPELRAALARVDALLPNAST